MNERRFNSAEEFWDSLTLRDQIELKRTKKVPRMLSKILFSPEKKEQEDEDQFTQPRTSTKRKK